MASATAVATAFVPSANGGHSKTPIGPFQKIVFAVPKSSAKRSRLFGPMSRPSQPSGHGVVGDHPRLGVGVEVGGGDDILGKLDLEVEGILVPELLRHLAADEHDVRPAAQVLEDAELVLHLGAARDERERALDVAEQPPEMLELLLEQQACVRGQDVRDALRGGVRPMCRAESVVDVEVHALRELPREPRVVRRLPLVEARVLEDAQAVVREQRVQPVGARRDREVGVDAVRPSEMGADDDLRSVVVEQPDERLERGPDAACRLRRGRSRAGR